jgi:sugar phosphate isomerase/epimerase
MKLGISSLSHIILTAKDYPSTDLHSLLLQATRSCLEFCESHQLEVCELIIDPITTFLNENRKEFIEVCKEYSIQKQVHAALIDVSLCSFNQEISEATLNTFKNNIEIASSFNAKTITIHPGVSKIPITAFKQKNLEILAIQIIRLLGWAKNSKVKICLENMSKDTGMCRNEKELLEIYQNVNDPDFYFTYDTSHLWMSDGDHHDFLHTLFPYIKNVHIADNIDKKRDQHPPIGAGNVPFPKIIEELKSLNYNESLIIELLDVSGLEKSIDYVTKLL